MTSSTCLFCVQMALCSTRGFLSVIGGLMLTVEHPPTFMQQQKELLVEQVEMESVLLLLLDLSPVLSAALCLGGVQP